MDIDGIAEKIFAVARERAKGEQIREVRIGLCYAGVRTSGGVMGMGAVLPGFSFRDCRALDGRGFAGRELPEVLAWLPKGRNPLERTLGLAAANAILNRGCEYLSGNSLEMMGLTREDRVCMVGRFPPLVSKIERAGASLRILEKDPSRGGIVDPGEQDRALAECTAAIITATTILNGTIEQVLGKLGPARHVAVLGPSTPLLPEAFAGTPVTHLGGSLVADPENVMRVISEAGGTPAMRPYLKFVNLAINAGAFE